VVGGGPTGVEMAGAIRELALHTMRHDFRSIDPATAKVMIIEGQNRVLGGFHEKLSGKARVSLEKMGVDVILDTHVSDIQSDHVMVKPDGGKGEPYRIDTSTIMWAAGVQANPLGKLLASAIGGVQVDKAGRVAVNPDCSVGNRPDIFVIGDLASLKGADGKLLPGLAPVAMQQGQYLADLIARRIRGEAPRGPFKYWDKGSMATIGRAKAVAESQGFRFSGFPAWLAWLFIHIMYLARFENRVLVLFQWFFNYVTRNSTARLITGEKATHS
jgi:NADH dehydrogenase